PPYTREALAICRDAVVRCGSVTAAQSWWLWRIRNYNKEFAYLKGVTGPKDPKIPRLKIASAWADDYLDRYLREQAAAAPAAPAAPVETPAAAPTPDSHRSESDADPAPAVTTADPTPVEETLLHDDTHAAEPPAPAPSTKELAALASEIT